MGTILKILLGVFGVGVVYSVGRSRGSYLEQIAHGTRAPDKGFLDSGGWSWLP